MNKQIALVLVGIGFALSARAGNKWDGDSGQGNNWSKFDKDLLRWTNYTEFLYDLFEI